MLFIHHDEPQVGEFQGEADLSPSPVVAGQQGTASDASCFEGTNAIWWSLRAYGEVVPSATGTVPLAGDGSWELGFAAPNETGERELSLGEGRSRDIWL